MAGRQFAALPNWSFWREAVNPGSARAAPSLKQRSASYFSTGAVLVRQLRGPHLSTWP